MDYRMLIGGRLVEGASSIPVINPATAEAFTTAPCADLDLLERAIAGAKIAFGEWSTCPLDTRRAKLEAFGDAIEARQSEIAHALTQEQGKPLSHASFEITEALRVLRYTLTLDLSVKLLRDDHQGKVFAQRSPLGIVAAIAPWNFPVLLMITKIAPALFAGNCVIAKPAPSTPLSTLLLGHAASETLPAGVLSTIVDQNDLGPILTSHRDIAKISFTGSTETGKKVMRSAADGLKRVTLELGGNDAAIVLDDVDIPTVAPAIFAAATLNAGQVCLAAKRIYAHRSVYDALCEALTQLANATVVDDGDKPGTEMGPIQNRQQFDKVRAYLAEAHSSGQVIAGGNALDRPGYFVPPTVVRDIAHDTMLVREEQFGPILPVIVFDTDDDVVAWANDSDYGLGGTIWTRDPERGFRLAMRINTGTLWINHHMNLPPDVPIGGAKESGIGLQYGQEGIDEFTQLKIIHVPS